MNGPAPIASGQRRLAIDLLVGCAGGTTYELVVEYSGHEGGLWYWSGPALLGLFLGSLLGNGGLLIAMPAFYTSGMVLLGVFGHLNLLPCAMMFFVVPTLLFAISAMAVQALAGKVLRRG